MQTISFTVNGRAIGVTADRDTPLLDVLRNHLGLMGTKFGCGEEQCGCCMVLIDGRPEKSCGKALATVAGRAVVTIEGLGTQERPHPLQQAFLDEQAGQCGYCLAGILISATALLDHNLAPSRGEIDPRRALADGLVIGDAFRRSTAGGIAAKIDGMRERPVIMAGGDTTSDDGAVFDREVGGGTAEHARGVVEEQRAHLGAGETQGDAAELNRLAAGGVALVRRALGVAGQEVDAIEPHAEFVGRDLPHRGQHALADFDPTGRYAHTSELREPDPLVEARVCREQRRQIR